MKAPLRTQAAEIANFAKDSRDWWDPAGPFAPLHRLNPARLRYITAQISTHFNRDLGMRDAFKGLSMLDIGCGGGLVCEPMARLGATVTGMDADKQAIAVAKDHAAAHSLPITYKAGFLDKKHPHKYDCILALELLEHLDDPAAFIRDCYKCLNPGGLVIFSTLNRTPKSFALGIVAAEYILRWVPQGTHTWRKFIKPSELGAMARDAGLDAVNVTGLVYHPLSQDFVLSPTDLSINYFLSAKSSSGGPVQSKKRTLR